MKNRANRYSIVAAIGAAVIAGGLVATAPGEALADAPGDVSNEQLPQLTAEWMQWALSLPNDVNPIVDTTGDLTGDLCPVGQRGPVWFLAGTFFGSTAPVKRTCMVPEGTTLLFPVINGFAFNTPGCFPQTQTDDLKTVQKLKQFYYPEVTQFVDKAHHLSATLNGHKLMMQRVEFAAFRCDESTGKHLGTQWLQYRDATRSGNLFAWHRRRLLDDNRKPEGIAEPLHDLLSRRVRQRCRGYHIFPDRGAGIAEIIWILQNCALRRNDLRPVVKSKEQP